MAYLPPVVARLTFDLGDFSARVDEAKEKLDSLNKSFTDTVKIKLDDSQAAQLKNMAQDLEALHRIGGQQATEGIKVQGFEEASAKLDDMALKMDRLNGKTANMHVKVDKSDLSQVEGVFGKIDGLFSRLANHSFNLPFVNFTANPMGLAAIVAGIAALLPELAGVVAGFAAAGAGAAAFGILAEPAVKHVTTAYSALSAAQKAYNAAKEKESLDPSKANMNALKSAADNLKVVQEQISKMPAAEQAAITGITNLSAAFSKQSKAFEPKVFEVFASGLRLAATLLPTITPFANTFADSLAKIFSNLNKSAQGNGFQNFLKQFHGIEGPALNAIAAGIGNVAGSVGRLLTVMSGKDVAHTLNIAFSAISGTIGGLTTTIKFLMNAWDGMGLAAKNVGHSLDSIRSAFDNVRHGLASMGDDILSAFKGIPGSIASIASKMAAPFKSVPSQIKGFFAGAAGWLISAGQRVVSGFVKGAQATWGAVSGFFGGIPGKVKGFFGGAAGWLVSAGEAIMSGLLSGLESAWGKVASFLSSLAAKIKSLKGPLDYDRIMLYPHGQAIMQGLMAGMGSQVPALEAQLRGITQMISQSGSAHPAAAAAADQPIHVHVQIDGREIASVVAQRSVQTQRRTGTNGLTKRTR